VIEMIVSGGQTGVDRAALDVALGLGIDIGGWVPLGRRSEDGTVPERYAGLQECGSPDYEGRTELNVRDSDATLILAPGLMTGGTALTQEIAARMRKPHLAIDLSEASLEECASRIREWLALTRPRVLNIAGPRASEAPGIEDPVTALLLLALQNDAA
jgi:hypothetical protein